ncbi:hypothetical protein M404DRAFT_996919 [Pisolithus tinctorius Marx 270]|uniref:Secreted protein n=1 Tax=Pisolithus tinctorius Marx 270 TaxID=870435 RepID=A0A0C3PKC4_PISTI|nr:hypothetical protein M404DRAFT_996919 [Pisolithus tinctorius Marx 270]
MPDGSMPTVLWLLFGKLRGTLYVRSDPCVRICTTKQVTVYRLQRTRHVAFRSACPLQGLGWTPGPNH